VPVKHLHGRVVAHCVVVSVVVLGVRGQAVLQGLRMLNPVTLLSVASELPHIDCHGWQGLVKDLSALFAGALLSWREVEGHGTVVLGFIVSLRGHAGDHGRRHVNLSTIVIASFDVSEETHEHTAIIFLVAGAHPVRRVIHTHLVILEVVADGEFWTIESMTHGGRPFPGRVCSG